MADQAGFLEYPHRHRHAGASHAQHRGQKFLGQVELPAADAILRHEEPAGTALLDDMEAVTGS